MRNRRPAQAGTPRRHPEILFRKLLEAAPDAVVITDRSGLIAMANPQAEKLFGYVHGELVGKSVEVLVPDDLRSAHREHRQRYALDPHVRPMGNGSDLRGRRKDGTIFPAEISLSPVDGEDGPLVFSSIRDITERLKREQQIQANLNIQSAIASILRLSLEPISLESFLERTLELLQDLPWLNLEKKAAIFLADDATQTLLMKAQIGLPATLLASCERVPFGKCLCGLAAQTRRVVHSACVGHDHEVVYDGISPHGHYCVPILSGERLHGVINLYIQHGHAQDPAETAFLQAVASALAGTIERKQYERELAESRERFDLAVTGTNAGIWDWNMLADAVYYSPRWKSMLGCREEEIGDSPAEWKDRLHPDDRRPVLVTMQRYLEGGIPELEIEYRLLHRDGAYRWFLGRGTVVRDQDGRPVRMVGSHIDITSRKQTEESLRYQESQLRAAQRIQEKILPEAPPDLPGFDIAGAYRPADFAAGDHFDYFTAPDGSLLLVVGDVSGHGFSTALLMASTHAYLRTLASMGLDIHEILARANAILTQETETEQFVTVILARIDTQTRRLDYVSAGHPTGYVLDAACNLKRTLPSTSLPLAVLDGAEFKAGCATTLEPGDLVLLLTDGILEARSPAGEHFGGERALRAACAQRHAGAAKIATAVCETARAHLGGQAQEDDFTALAIKVR